MKQGESCAAQGVYFSCSVLCTLATPANGYCATAHGALPSPVILGLAYFFSLKQCKESS